MWKEDLPKLDSFVAAAMASPEGAASSYDESLEIRFNNREDAWGQFDIRQFRDIDGRDCFVAALTDISRQKKAEALHVRGLEARRFEAEENRRNTEAFLDMSSHELRNPLSGVVSPWNTFASPPNPRADTPLCHYSGKTLSCSQNLSRACQTSSRISAPANPSTLECSMTLGKK